MSNESPTQDVTLAKARLRQIADEATVAPGVQTFIQHHPLTAIASSLVIGVVLARSPVARKFALMAARQGVQSLTLRRLDKALRSRIAASELPTVQDE